MTLARAGPSVSHLSSSGCLTVAPATEEASLDRATPLRSAAVPLSRLQYQTQRVGQYLGSHLRAAHTAPKAPDEQVVAPFGSRMQRGTRLALLEADRSRRVPRLQLGQTRSISRTVLRLAGARCGPGARNAHAPAADENSHSRTRLSSAISNALLRPGDSVTSAVATPMMSTGSEGSQQ